MTLFAVKYPSAGKLLLAAAVAAVSGCAAMAGAQTVPVQTGSPLYSGFRIPTVPGNLRFSASVSEQVGFNYADSGQTLTTTSASAQLAFITASVTHPSSLLYSGGFLSGNNYQPASTFQNLSFSQRFDRRSWNVEVGDSVQYLPETPSTGLSGIPGVGDIGTGTVTTQGILTPYATRISNTAHGLITAKLTGSTQLSAGGQYEIQRFLGNSSALESNDYAANAGVEHRVDARTSVGASGHYSDFSYLNYDSSFSSTGGQVSFRRSLTRQVTVSVAAGPEYVGSSSVTGRPGSLTYSADAHVTYSGSRASELQATAGYVRATNSGSGTTVGAQTDTIAGSLSRTITRSLHVSAQMNYGRNSGLTLLSSQPLNTTTLAGSLQANRAIARVWSVYASYTALEQTYSGLAQGIAPLSGISQIVAFGLTYSPAQIHLGRQ